jgi:hypothetical protein
MSKLNTILATLFLCVLASCTLSLRSAAAWDYSSTPSPWDSSPYSTPGAPGTFDNRGRQYQDYGSLGNEQDRNQWSSGQPHKPSDQWTPPIPTTKDQYIYDGRTGQSRLCTSDGRGFTFCQ